MALSRDPPFFAGAIVGIRAWTVEAKLPSSEIRLGAAVAMPSWEPGGDWTRAICHPLGEERPARHEAPQAGCSCGLYAWHPFRGHVRELFDEHVTGEGSAAPDDPCFVEIVGPVGLVEACGRIELHGEGFRAERARPLALIAGSRWPETPRAAIEELAALYGCEVLVVGSSRELLERARELPGVLSPERIEELLVEVRPEPPPRPPPGPGRAPPPPGWTPAPAPPPAPPSRSERLREAAARAGQLLGQALAMLFFTALSIGIYGSLALVGITFVGGALFGWFGFDDEPAPPPARVQAVTLDRERCRIEAAVLTRRRVGKLTLRLTGRDDKGKGLGHTERIFGPLPKGHSEVLVLKLGRRVCEAPFAYSARVRPVWPELLGAPASVRAGPGEVETGLSNFGQARKRERAGRQDRGASGSGPRERLPL